MRYQEIVSSITNSVHFTRYTLLNIMCGIQFFTTNYTEINTLHRGLDAIHITRVQSKTSAQHPINVHSLDNIRHYCNHFVFELYIHRTKFLVPQY
jgi:hypoxanthine-guanine phosphoribosyltransferase